MKGETGAAWRRVSAWAVFGCVLGLSIMFSARLLGPSDAWDQTQPKTMAYTTDIVVHGRWALPREQGSIPASKPPFYNWLAAPFVALLGPDRELAHRAPSVLATVGCVLVVVAVGRRIGSPMRIESGSNRAYDADRESRGRSIGSAIGWLAALMLPANYTLFKLSALVRPDMVLTCLLTAGWFAASVALLGDVTARARVRASIGFWLCVALAALTKGPPALLLPIYAIVAARPLGGSFGAVRRVGWWWGVPLALVPMALWVIAVHRIDAEHLFGRLWHDEVWGRVTGTGPLGRKSGFSGWLTGLGHMPLYFLARAAPWSIVAMLGALWLVGRDASGQRRWRLRASTDGVSVDPRWIVAALLMFATVLLFFTLSAGKRSDYIAAAYPPAAVLAATWLLFAAPRIGLRLPWLAPLTATVVVIVLGVNEFSRWKDPGRPFVTARQRFIAEAVEARRRAPWQIAFLRTGDNELQALLGASVTDDAEAVALTLARGEPFWLVARSVGADERWLQAELGVAAEGWRMRQVTQLMPHPPAERTGWPARLGFYLVEPPPARGVALGAADGERSGNADSSTRSQLP